jgi:hypothetical protein|tara:strand:+ start:292 stop:462 length:171 start_codon:yes stop_codon:yes gene_type:complete
MGILLDKVIKNFNRTIVVKLSERVADEPDYQGRWKHKLEEIDEIVEYIEWRMTNGE